MATHLSSARLLAVVSCIAVQVAAEAFQEGVPALASSLLMSKTRVHRKGAAAPTATATVEAPTAVVSRGEKCASLSNAGSHFTVDVEVGTPPQTFSVVADTGSNSLIVPSCICQQSGSCRGSKDRCFTGTNRSSSFQLVRSKDTGKPEEMLLTFGSGQIDSVVAKDEVAVGGLTTFMEDGFLLMVDRALDIEGPFEGILGLGLPPDAAEGEEEATSEGGGTRGGEEASARDVIQRIIEKILGGGSGSGAAGGNVLAPDTAMPIHMTSHAVGSHSPQATSFLTQAGVSRFSLCLGEETGALRLDTPPALNALGSVGTAHWGLDFRGISVGKDDSASSSSVRLDICGAEHMAEGQETPCGMIPDSGTTLLMGPKEHISKLQEAACDAWPRCATNYTAMKAAAKAAEAAATDVYGMSPWKMTLATKDELFEHILEDCHSWMGGSNEGIGELPPLHFHLAGPPSSSGGSGRSMTLELRGEDYVMETLAPSSSADHASVPGGASSSRSPNPTICRPAFGAMEYPTQANGPVWIMGLPLFFAYTVAYDMEATPRSVAFTSVREAPCGGCGAGVELVASGSQVSGRSQQRRKLPRRVEGAPRVPTMDVSQPL